MTYPLISFKKISTVVTGSTPKTEVKEYYNGGEIPFITPTELGKSIYVSKAKTYVTEAGAKQGRIIPKNSIMVCCIGSLGKIGLTECELITNQQINSLVINEDIVNPLYVYFYCLTIKPILENMAPATTIAIVNKSRFSELTTPLPPLETQKQIAQVLATADQLRKDCQQVEQELNTLAQSVFLEMFGDPVTNPKNWKKVPVSYFVNEFQGGKSLASTGDEKSESTYRVLKISAVTWKDFNPLESKPLPNDHKPNANHFVKQNDLLFSRANTKELVGATSYVFETPNNILLPDKLWRFVWKQETKVAPLFIWYLFLNEGIRYQLGKLATGSGGSMKNISKSKLMPFKVIFPSYEQQKKFSAKIKHIRELQKINLAEKGRYEILFNSLLQKAFKGELNLKATS